jgi:hypothetical protein
VREGSKKFLYSYYVLVRSIFLVKRRVSIFTFHIIPSGSVWIIGTIFRCRICKNRHEKKNESDNKKCDIKKFYSHTILLLLQFE